MPTEDDPLNYSGKIIEMEEFLAIAVREDGSCALLDLKTQQCTAYKTRPYRCKSFSCWNAFVNRKIPLDDLRVEELLRSDFGNHDPEEFVGLKRLAKSSD